MSADVFYRYGYTSGETQAEPHGSLKRTINGVANSRVQLVAMDADAADWGGGSTGNIFNAISADDSPGSFLTCSDRAWVLIKAEISATGIRRARVVYKDHNGTVLYGVGEELEFRDVGPANGNATVAPTKVSGYRHAGFFRVSTLGMAAVSLWLLDGASSPTLHVWGTCV
jgi:hypothetical protein